MFTSLFSSFPCKPPTVHVPDVSFSYSIRVADTALLRICPAFVQALPPSLPPSTTQIPYSPCHVPSHTILHTATMIVRPRQRLRQQQQQRQQRQQPHHSILLLFLVLLACRVSSFVLPSPSSSSSSSSRRAASTSTPRSASSCSSSLLTSVTRGSHIIEGSRLRSSLSSLVLLQATFGTEKGGEAGTEEERRAEAARQLAAELEKERAQADAANAMERMKEELAQEKRQKIVTAVGSVLGAVALFFYQHTHPVEAITLLRQMQSESPTIQTVVGNGRPTVVDFYAEWCENCKEMAPVLRAVEGKYKDKVNFVVIDGDGRDQASAMLVERFRVDGIPHLALLTKEGEVKTALIGKIPKKVLEADIDSLIAGHALPYEGYDAFEDDNHFVTF